MPAAACVDWLGHFDETDGAVIVARASNPFSRWWWGRVVQGLHELRVQIAHSVWCRRDDAVRIGENRVAPPRDIIEDRAHGILGHGLIGTGYGEVSWKVAH